MSALFNNRLANAAVIFTLIISFITLSGCIFNNADIARRSELPPNDTSAVPAAVPPASTVTPASDGAGGGSNLVSGTQGPSPGGYGVSPSPSPTPAPQASVSAVASDWGTDKDTYARGDTASGWTYVTNTGTVPIDQVDFTLTISRTDFFVPLQRTVSRSSAGLGIQPGERRRVQFSQPIPAEYSGISTAGGYQFTVTASVGGQSIGSCSKSLTVI